MKLVQSNIYTSGTASLAELFADYLEGMPSSSECISLVLGSRTLDANARNAIEKSLVSFGYGARDCTYASLMPKNPESEGGDIPLDPGALYVLIEGFDPLFMICADQAAADAVAAAYRTVLEPDTAARVLGRPLVAFGNLAHLLESTEGKQRAWALLKTLPKR